ncbi:hypothetical protein GMA3_10 [Gordonia phage GMA3]|uniref:Phage virion morphogenesis protein n=1 Tax=Gordonia phage GMA3 TaxID=1647284 RepID=A0A0K0NKW9_9CAUD|nr:tail completion or Neck1 protein [Gordonia phage GMA3]AKL88187.1 hypothetical protein GMA3_10 [Gordonia phage GMA3]
MAVAGIELEGEHVNRVIADLNNRLGTVLMTATLTTVHGHFLNKTERMFQDERDPYGNKWAPLAESTISFRESLGYGGAHPINVRTGGLRDSMTSAPPDILGHSDGVVTLAYPSRKMPAGNDGMKHRQAAGMLKGPARPVIGMDEKDVAFVLGTLRSNLFTALGRGR